MRATAAVVRAGIVVLMLVAVVGTAFAQAQGARPGAGAGRAGGIEGMLDQLKQAGATDADIAALTAFWSQRRDIMSPLRDGRQSLQQAASASGTAEQAKDAVSKYEAAMKAALEKLAKAEQDLKTKLDLANKPKLHAALLAGGVLDNGMRGGGGAQGAPGGRRAGAGGRRGGARGAAGE